jgi:hypothetical protein
MEINIEKRQSAAIPSFEILWFDILLFCGSLFSGFRVQPSSRPPKRAV